MASVNFNPPQQGQLTDDPRYNERNFLQAGLTTPAFYAVIGVPPAGLGNNNDFAWRWDGTEAGHTLAYHKEAGAWVATAM